MKSFDVLERQLFIIQPQPFFTKEFFKELQIYTQQGKVNITDNEIIIHEELIKRFGIKNICPKLFKKDRFNSNISFIIREYFGVEDKKEENEIYTETYKMEKPLIGVLPREEFINKYPTQKLPDRKYPYEFIPLSTMTYTDFCTLSNTFPDFKFIPNPFLSVKPYCTNISDTLQKISITLRKKVQLGDKFGKKVVTKLGIDCKCGSTIMMTPNDTSSKITHDCGRVIVNGEEKKKNITLEKSGLYPLAEKELYLYECSIDNEADNTKMDTIYLYSLDPNLTPGKYYVNVWNTYVWEYPLKNHSFYPIALSVEKQEIVIDSDLLKNNHPTAKEYCEKRKLPYVKFLDVLFSWRDASLKYAGRKIDNRGMLLQLFLTISGLAKVNNNFDKLGVCIIGNKSLSKTYPSYLAGALYDIDFEHISSSQDISLAGVRGGINNNALINGKTTSIFEKGVFSTAGLTLFDEGEKFFDDADMNMVLKTFLDEYINIKKVGGKKVEQTYTPLIMSNFPINHTIKYKEEVKRAYEKLIKLNDESHEHGLSKEEISMYISDLNLYLPTPRYDEDYKNKTLAKCVGLVRHKMKGHNIDWRTGGTLPASYRLLFDVTCWNVDEYSFSNDDRVIGQTESVLPSPIVFPTLQFKEAIRIACKHKIINLKYEQYNDEHTVTRLKDLEDDISSWFRFDERGKAVFLHLSDGKKEIDPKLNGLVYTAIKTIQVYEDLSTSGELQGRFSDNVKYWAYLILSKCKRGVTKAEYNFEEHYDNIIPVNEKFSQLEAEIEKIKDQEEAEKLERVVQKELKKKEDENSLSVKESSLLDNY